MASSIRRATAFDAPLWLELVQTALGGSYPFKSIYDLDWITGQLNAETGHETWVAEVDGQLNASISFLKPFGLSSNPVANLGRNLLRAESVEDGSAELLLRSVTDLTAQRNEMAIVRVASTDKAQQMLFEKIGYACMGFQPLKHLLHQRVGVLFYVHGVKSVVVNRIAPSETLPQVSELSSAALESLKIPNPSIPREGVCGYPLQCGLAIQEVALGEYENQRRKAEGKRPPMEVSGRFNYGSGLMRLPGGMVLHGLLGLRDKNVVAGLIHCFDEQDRCARVIEAFCADDLSMGVLLAQALRLAEDQLQAVYTEIDILATAPRLIKSAEQLGFCPVAYLPAFFCGNDRYSDVVKLVKLNFPYALEETDLTPHARKIVDIIDKNFQDQKAGLPVVNLLRPLSLFAGLGDGDLRNVARLFEQKLYRPGDQIFAKGDAGDEAFLVLKGKIGIHLDPGAPAKAQFGDGRIFGELALLDESPRVAYTIASQPSILLVMKRAAFAELIGREPNLGATVMQNLAQEMAVKLRSVNEALATVKKTDLKA